MPLGKVYLPASMNNSQQLGASQRAMKCHKFFLNRAWDVPVTLKVDSPCGQIIWHVVINLRFLFKLWHVLHSCKLVSEYNLNFASSQNGIPKDIFRFVNTINWLITSDLPQIYVMGFIVKSTSHERLCRKQP